MHLRLRRILAGESSIPCEIRSTTGYFADPFVFQAKRRLPRCPERAHAPHPDRVFPLLRSFDFCRWELLGGALVPCGERATRYWAPEVAEANGIFYMYYSAGMSDEKHELRSRDQHPARRAVYGVRGAFTGSFDGIFRHRPKSVSR